jgi:acetoin utilization protein AcuB
MFVRDCMTPDPVTVRPESDPLAARMLLRYRKFRHLPVVTTEGELAGILSGDDLELFLAQAEAPTITKRQHRVDQAMTRDVVAVPPDCPLEEAANLMIAHKIGSLPVIEAGRVVGIVTETDIFRQLSAMLGGGRDALRLTVQVDDTPGQLADLAGLVAQVGGNISSIVAHAADKPERLNLTLRVEGVERQVVLDAVSGLPELDVLHAWEPEAG